MEGVKDFIGRGAGPHHVRPLKAGEETEDNLTNACVQLSAGVSLTKWVS